MTYHEQTAEEALAITMKAMRELGASEEAIDAAAAKNVLHEDLGYFKSETQSYNLDDKTRDKLIVHTRQDVANAVYAATTAGKKVKALQASVGFLTLLVLVLLCLQVWQLFT